ncbi:uncharacterized protein LOC132902881 [Amyelois transitella]|uniref:uncharacterized protein LOC132902881 n=1 Tax=Amyelois transitella TaxID=680683 RepID=UPI00299023D4|nr:uncharacterized protein LOC132902881 [Amyelois transitella]
MTSKTIIIFILFHYSLARTIINSHLDQDSNIQESIINCGTEIANKHFDYRIHTAVYFNDVEIKHVNSFLISYKGTVIIECKRDTAPPKQVVVIVETFHSFMKILYRMKPDLRGKTLLSSGTKFIILFLSTPKKVDKIFAILWSYHVTNVVTIANEKTNITLYTYFPYRNQFDCQNTLPKMIGVWKGNAITENIFSNKMKNMQGCPLYISTDKLYHPELEYKVPLQIIKKVLLKLLRDKMNFTAVTSIRDYVSLDLHRARNWSDSLNDVVSGRDNISTCSIPLGVDKSGLLDFSTPYFRVRHGWLAPPISPGPVLWRLLTPLNGYLWLILLIVVTIVNLIPIVWKIRSVKKFGMTYFKNFKRLHGIIFRSWGVMMGQPVRMAPKRFRDLYIIGLWIWFTFVVRSAYQSVLILALKTDTADGAFNNLKESIDYGYKFGGRATFINYFEYDQGIKDMFIVIPDSEFDNMFWDVVEGRKKFVLAISLEYAWAYCLSRGRKENECGLVLVDSILSVPLVIWTRHQSPFARLISIWIQRFVESGLLDREWVNAPSVTSVLPSDATPLTWKQTTSCMLCYLLGVAISIIVFLIELALHKIKKKKIKFVL